MRTIERSEQFSGAPFPRALAERFDVIVLPEGGDKALEDKLFQDGKVVYFLGIGNVLYGVNPHDTTTFLAVVLTLAIVALVACAAPAWRAAKTKVEAELPKLRSYQGKLGSSAQALADALVVHFLRRYAAS